MAFKEQHHSATKKSEQLPLGVEHAKANAFAFAAERSQPLSLFIIQT